MHRLLLSACALLLTLPLGARAGDVNVPEVVTENGRNPNSPAVALINMAPVYDDCEQAAYAITVDGVQFSDSGQTLELLRFGQTAMPTGIDRLSNVEQSHANNFIRVGRRYFIHYQACGASGRSLSLVALYAL